jgi:branched-chain amino acid transport system ATP-binding protein
MLVEHDMNLVMGICSRVVVLASGRKIADAEPAVVRADAGVLEAYLGVEE